MTSQTAAFNAASYSNNTLLNKLHVTGANWQSQMRSSIKYTYIYTYTHSTLVLNMLGLRGESNSCSVCKIEQLLIFLIDLWMAGTQMGLIHITFISDLNSYQINTIGGSCRAQFLIFLSFKKTQLSVTLLAVCHISIIPALTLVVLMPLILSNAIRCHSQSSYHTQAQVQESRVI